MCSEAWSPSVAAPIKRVSRLQWLYLRHRSAWPPPCSLQRLRGVPSLPARLWEGPYVEWPLKWKRIRNRIGFVFQASMRRTRSLLMVRGHALWFIRQGRGGADSGPRPQRREVKRSPPASCRVKIPPFPSPVSWPALLRGTAASYAIM